MAQNKAFIFILLVALLLILGCLNAGNSGNQTPSNTPATSQKTVQIGDRVDVTYLGYIKKSDGKNVIFDKTPLDQPAEFHIGTGELIPGFDQGLMGMKEGEFKKITVPPALGYGEQDPAKIIQEGIHILQNNGYTVEVAEKVKTANGDGVITAIDENAGFATVNYNNPLSGKTLYFEVTVVKIAK